MNLECCLSLYKRPNKEKVPKEKKRKERESRIIQYRRSRKKKKKKKTRRKRLEIEKIEKREKREVDREERSRERERKTVVVGVEEEEEERENERGTKERDREGLQDLAKFGLFAFAWRGRWFFFIDIDLWRRRLVLSLCSQEHFALQKFGVRVQTHQKENGNLNVIEHVKRRIVNPLFER